MEPAHQASLTPEQIAAIQSGGGFAFCEDPSTHMHYQLIQVDPAAIDDSYIRTKIDEAYAEPGAIRPLDMATIKLELNRRLSTNKSGT